MRVRSLTAALVAAVVSIPGNLNGQALKAEGSGLRANSYGADSLTQQQSPPPPRTPGIVKYGKWGAAGLFVAAMSLGVVEHSDANSRFETLRRFCGTGGSCSIGPDGRYTDGQAEALYQDVVTGDRAARSLFIVGEMAFAGASALFIVELMHGHGTHNIPYSGLVFRPSRTGTLVGVRLPIRGP